jgi:predicted transcriptional regulator
MYKKLSSRRGPHEGTLIVRLDPALKDRLKLAATLQHTDMSKISRQVITGYVERFEREGKGRQLVEELTGRAGPGMTTDEIMALTRGE